MRIMLLYKCGTLSCGSVPFVWGLGHHGIIIRLGCVLGDGWGDSRGWEDGREGGRGDGWGTVDEMVSLATLQTPLYMVIPLRAGVWRVATLTNPPTVPTAIPPTVPPTIEAGAHPNAAGANC